MSFVVILEALVLPKYFPKGILPRPFFLPDWLQDWKMFILTSCSVTFPELTIYLLSNTVLHATVGPVNVYKISEGQIQ